MENSISSFSRKKELVIFLGIVVLFLALRLPALYAPYHQDEYKWPILMNPALSAPGSVPHPPLSEAIYRATFKIFGEDNFRVTPFLFSLMNLVLLYIVVKKRHGVRPALWSSLFFTLSFYGILASLMVDTDGAILPFFLLLSLYFYEEFKSNGSKKFVWAGLLVLSLLGGLLVKMSFILVLGALILDFIWDRQDKTRILVASLGFLALVGVVLYLAQSIFAGFDLSTVISYSKKFMTGFADRNFFQTAIQLTKALFYLSPFLVFAFLFSFVPYKREIRLFHIFIGLGLIFYLGLFDFSGGALDRYLQFLIIPLCVVAGFLFQSIQWQNKKFIYSSILIALVIFFIQFFPQYVPSLHPKSEWIGRILSLKWNFLYPFTGGSGPLTFYVSFAFLGLSWIFGAIITGIYLWKKNLRAEALTCLLLLGLVYNAVFAEEYLFGKMNGSAAKLVGDAAAFIAKNPDIKKVVVYNDNGGREIQKTGKYEKRLYTSPQFDLMVKIETINNFKGHYLEIDAPPIDPASVYRSYLDSCKVIYEQKSGYINSRIYDCRNAPKITE